jgi:hypothetical protein
MATIRSGGRDLRLPPGTVLRGLHIRYGGVDPRPDKCGNSGRSGRDGILGIFDDAHGGRNSGDRDPRIDSGEIIFFGGDGYE